MVKKAEEPCGVGAVGLDGVSSRWVPVVGLGRPVRFMRARWRTERGAAVVRVELMVHNAVMRLDCG